MPMELSMPVLALTGAALTALITWRLWPRIAVRTYREKHPDFGIREIAFSFSRPGRLLGVAPSHTPARFEFVIYMTMKSCNQ
jgi:hypothetical protein